MRRSTEVYGFITDVTELAVDGWYGNPTWATEKRAERFVDLVSDGVVELVRAVVAAHQGSASRTSDVNPG